MPTGIDFITCDKQYIHNMIVIILKTEGISFEKPSALFAKELDAVPKITAKNNTPPHPPKAPKGTLQA